MLAFPIFDLFSSPLLLLLIQGVIFSILLLTRYRRKKKTVDLLLSFILLITCYHQINYTIGFMGWYDAFPTTKVNYYLVNLSLVLAPLIYLYVRRILQLKISKKDILHFIPWVLFFAIKLGIYFYDAQQVNFDQVQNGDAVINFEWVYVDPIIGFLSMLQMIIYLFLSLQLYHSYRKKIIQYYSNRFDLELNWIRNALLIYSFLYVFYCIQEITNALIVDLSWRQEWWYYLLSGIAILYIGVKGYFTDVSVLHDLDFISFSEKATNHKSITIEAVPDSKKELLLDFIKSNKLFLESNLTLVSLAKQLNWSREELSETINLGFGKNFNDFINEFRVNEVKQLISQKKHIELSLLGIAFEAGFNSKATFNRVFKKMTMQSPSEYAKNNS